MGNLEDIYLLKNKLFIDKKIVYSLIFSLYFLFTLLRFLYPANVLLTSIVVGLGLFSLVSLSSTMKLKDIFIYFYILGLIIFVLISAIITSRYERLGHVFLFILSNTGIAFIILRSYVYKWACYYVFYILAIFFLYQILSGVNADDAVTVVSHNGISMIILVACITLYLIVSIEFQKISLIPAVLTAIICIWGTGRSGILASFLLLLGLILVKYEVKKHVVIIILSPFLILYLFFESIIAFAIQIPFFTQAATNYLVRANGEPEVRLDIWNNYFNNLNFSKFLFGVNPKIDPWPDGQILAYNYHNTFINLHAQAGLMGIITMLLLTVSFFKLIKYNKVLSILLLTLLTRWFTDTGLYFESWDFLPYFFSFIILSRKYLENNKIIIKV